MSSDLIWHYTDTAGLIGMTVKHTLWATAVSFLNDPGERNYADQILSKAAPREMLEMQGPSDDYSGFYRRYLACASRAEDDLELWRGYGSNRVSTPRHRSACWLPHIRAGQSPSDGKTSVYP